LIATRAIITPINNKIMEIKTMNNVGTAKYVVSYYDGKKQKGN